LELVALEEEAELVAVAADLQDQLEVQLGAADIQTESRRLETRFYFAEKSKIITDMDRKKIFKI
jgi:hypothetical protein